MKTFLIGDVHGCLNELKALVDKISPNHDDTIIVVGDLVDKGPHSYEVIQYVKQHPNFKILCGNHEYKAIRLYDADRTEEGELWVDQMKKEDWDYLKTFPLLMRLPEHNALLVHGGLFPAFFRNHGALPKTFDSPEWANWRTDKSRYFNRARRFLYIRKVSASGNMVSLGDPPGVNDTYWTNTYDGHEGHVYFGHHPQHSGLPLVTPHATGLDTACVFGGKLTAALLLPSGAEFISVPSEKKYANPFIGDEGFVDG